ncbi:hypothetical protein IIB79_05415 [candidate division KSB1 bacterium]|nr:hypothetical protein [candidate division KSB1 bacterium]
MTTPSTSRKHKEKRAAVQPVLLDNSGSKSQSSVMPHKKESFWSVLFSGGSVIVPSTKLKKNITARAFSKRIDSEKTYGYGRTDRRTDTTHTRNSSMNKALLRLA